MSKTKPAKPYGDYPLFAHASGKWAKKINGKIRYFGSWDDPDGALVEYRDFTAESLDVADATLTLADAANMFLVHKQSAVQSERLSQRSYTEYRSTLGFVLNHFGRTADIADIGPLELSEYHRERSKVRNLVSMGNECVRIKTFFSWLAKSDVIDKEPKYPEEFKKPSKKEMRRHKRNKGTKVLRPEQILRLLDTCGLEMQAMILLGVNCAFSPADIASLRLGDWDGTEALDIARVKTEIDRRCFLWPETIEALNAAKRLRFPPANRLAAESFFLKPSGRPFDKGNCEVTKWFTQIAKWAGVDATFYYLRHTHQNIGERTGDSVAVKVTMGHADNSISDTYRHGIADERIIAVTNTIRTWLYG